MMDKSWLLSAYHFHAVHSLHCEMCKLPENGNCAETCSSKLILKHIICGILHVLELSLQNDSLYMERTLWMTSVTPNLVTTRNRYSCFHSGHYVVEPLVSRPKTHVAWQQGTRSSDVTNNAQRSQLDYQFDSGHCCGSWERSHRTLELEGPSNKPLAGQQLLGNSSWVAQSLTCPLQVP